MTNLNANAIVATTTVQAAEIREGMTLALDGANYRVVRVAEYGAEAEVFVRIGRVYEERFLFGAEEEVTRALNRREMADVLLGV